jgi:hypothetical protein
MGGPVSDGGQSAHRLIHSSCRARQTEQ